MSPQTWELRQAVLRKYGGRCVCPCGCQDQNLRRLQLDHLHGGGSDDRKHRRGNTLYKELLSKPVDPAFRCLCVGCHWELTLFGTCEQTGGAALEAIRGQAVEPENPVEPYQSWVDGPAPSVQTPALERAPQVYKHWWRR